MFTFRDAILRVVPPWLRGARGSRLLFSIAIVFDLLLEKCRAAVKSRFPGQYTVETAERIGRERRYDKADTETAGEFAMRLPGWLDAHGRRGNSYVLLEQLHDFWGGLFRIELVYASGRRYVLETDGTITEDDTGWTIPDPEDWARFWLFFWWPEVDAIDDGLWGDSGFWGDGGVWGTSLTMTEVEAVRRIPEAWNAAHARGAVVLLHPTDDPADYWADPDVFVTLALRT